MNENEILAKVNDIFRRVFENDQLVVSGETTAEDVEEWDSLSHTMMIVEVEKYFNIKFKLKEVLSFRNVGDMVKIIAERKGS